MSYRVYEMDQRTPQNKGSPKESNHWGGLLGYGLPKASASPSSLLPSSPPCILMPSLRTLQLPHNTSGKC